MKASLRNKKGSVRWLTLMLGAGGAWLGVAGCSSTSILSPHEPPKEVAVPAYAYLPHPAGHTTSDLISLFSEKGAPSRETMAKCEEDFRSLYSKVQSIEERTKGVQELISRNPAAYHWCFYSQIISLEEGLSQDEFVDQKQKRIMNTYEYLVPVARAFAKEFQDSRYLRWAIQDYRRLADLYFYRKLEMSPQMSSVLVDVAVPAEMRSAPVADESHPVSVLEKYKIGNSIPESAVVVQAQSEEASEKPEAAPPPPALAEPVAKAEDSEKAEASDPDVKETLQYAQELARQQKEASRAPAGQVAPAAAPISPPAPEAAPLPPPALEAAPLPPPAVVSPVTEPPKEELPAVQ